ncbi:MAG: AAA family ATPase [Lachnospiraceae bacterium]|nr:AAA family ATPase [Lachnospiraceae bacterium]
MKLRIVVVDKDEGYLKRITDVFQLKYFNEIEISTFTQQEKVDSFLENNDIDAVLFSEEYSLKNYKGIKFKLITEGEQKDEGGIKTLKKFQKVENIYRHILNAYAETKDNYKFQSVSAKSGTKVVTFCSSNGGVGKTTCALVYARMMGMIGKNVLYLNTEKLPSTPEYFTIPSYDKVLNTMSQVFFSVKAGKGNIPMKIESSLNIDENGVYYFVPSENPLEIMEMKADDWKQLMIQLVSMKKFDLIVVDSDTDVNETFFEIADLSDVLVEVNDVENLNASKFASMVKGLKLVERRRKSDWLNRMVIVLNKVDGHEIPEKIHGITVLGTVLKINGTYIAEETVRAIIENNCADALQRLVSLISEGKKG